MHLCNSHKIVEKIVKHMYEHVGVSRGDTREKKAVESLLAAQVRRLEEEVASKENDYSQRMNVLQDKYRNMEVS